MCVLCRVLFPLSEPTMGFGWVMSCVTCTFCESCGGLVQFRRIRGANL